jgi:hypothetical protein
MKLIRCHITTFDSVRFIATETLANRSSRCYRTYKNLLVRCFFVTAVSNLVKLIPGYIAALLLFLDMLTFVSPFVALPLFFATNIFFRAALSLRKEAQREHEQNTMTIHHQRCNNIYC